MLGLGFPWVTLWLQKYERLFEEFSGILALNVSIIVDYFGLSMFHKVSMSTY